MGDLDVLPGLKLPVADCTLDSHDMVHGDKTDRNGIDLAFAKSKSYQTCEFCKPFTVCRLF